MIYCMVLAVKTATKRFFSDSLLTSWVLGSYAEYNHTLHPVIIQQSEKLQDGAYFDKCQNMMYGQTDNTLGY